MDIIKLVKDEDSLRKQAVDKTEKDFDKNFDQKEFVKNPRQYMDKWKKNISKQVQVAFLSSAKSGAKNAKI